ncbi:MAG: radical SAM protein [Negativicutes bacterium]|nr:radical SAM protein [Negativicutes bacterium]
MFFRLHDHCVLVEGARKGAIYNLETGKVHPINGGALALLKECQSGPLTDILDMEDTDSKPYLDFLQRLTEMGLGSVYFSAPAPHPPLPEADRPKLEFLWLELTSACNNRCLHCYAASAPDVPPQTMPHERWLSLISEARQAGATAIQLIGGEPLLYPRWRELVIKARDEGYEFIEIFTNATLIDDACIDFFQQHGVHIATTIYADNPEVHDKVTQNPGSFTKTYSAIQKILAAGIPLRIASILMKVNEYEAENIMKLCSELGVQADPPDIVRPTGRGDAKDLLPENYVKPPIKPPFYTDAPTFVRVQRYHPCLAGKIAVLPTGDVIPCIFARNQVCGNIFVSPLTEILSGQSLLSYWCTTKDQVEKCKDCEFRYACADCRPLAQGSDPEKRWLACSTGCSYNPYLGEWEE